MISMTFTERGGVPSGVSDPFNKESIQGIYLSVYKSSFGSSQTIYITGRVKFKNGNTEGEQKLEAKSFDELVKKMDHFIQSLS